MLFHVVPLDDWLLAPDRPYAPRALAEDGFISCTPDEKQALAVADARFREAVGPLMALMIDERRLDARVCWDPAPRIHGRVNRSAVAGMLEVRRDDEGRAVDLALWS
ncbi:MULTISPECIES: DUF952 domain-containing protein [Streptomyces]|uniref:DUF952 domain-containing protein n=1 Tax=Streptomyces qinglanensis TaxID=943816 RepID=A0A1E7K3E9_9ACTN|nr:MULTISPECIES: DUF952 domain-containing protein [Streptomyces]MBE9499322.1 DUF952 domain-containing protein [Streptomyces sp. GKU 257-1]OEV24796.1 hypothetical protein AN220_17390 [Streptomyces nanshensis]MDF4249737.1 DUF952 domain-containing protein [Streptomyces sp. WMMB303]OEU98439.1 hypothetical protein AN217_12145 [Streptomyces qinglanensis]SER92413.1 Protein of unknown function [Streptomyces qinglanensis]